MGVVRFADNQVMVDQGAQVMTLYSDPVPMGGNDYAELVWTIHTFAVDGGTPTVSLALQGQASNDGVSWFNVTALADTKTALGSSVTEIGGFVRAAFLRMRYTLTSEAGQFAWAAFDVHANLMKSGS